MQKHIVNKPIEEQRKREAYIKRVEEDQKGNPLLKPDVNVAFPTLTEQERINATMCDYLGNPLPGYKMVRREGIVRVVEIGDNREGDRLITATPVRGEEADTTMEDKIRLL